MGDVTVIQSTVTVVARVLVGDPGVERNVELATDAPNPEAAIIPACDHLRHWLGYDIAILGIHAREAGR